MKPEWLTLDKVQARYKIPYPQLLTMQLMRFKGNVPSRKTGPGKRYRKLVRITKALHRYLTRLNCHA